ncbi:hypothetical protein [Iningainema tapete]|uniref:Uncharacterized protein n=1 Tax=Iningainema tapete BLCC-T55 TaxID=2748662 RepID=A0A8J7C5S6_9CYAN|nr:hypothetical protein [Iningainema tapete]MBD2773444.1 hypothetical protein [Iningainema tapete BLCC-T55]
MSSKETTPNQAEKTNPEADASQLSPEVLDMIKHPPSIDDVMRDLPPEEVRNNPAIVPEMLDEPSDEMTGFGKD